MLTTTMPLFTGFSRNTQSKSYALSLTECVWDFQSNALSDMFSVCPRMWQAYRTIFLLEYSSYTLEIPNDAYTTLKFETQSNFDWLFNTLSRVLQVDWVILEIKEKATLSVTCPVCCSHLTRPLSTTNKTKSKQGYIWCNVLIWAEYVFKIPFHVLKFSYHVSG